MAKLQQISGLLALITAVAVLGILVSQLSQKVEQFSFARSDSDAWNFAQVEVAFTRLHAALLEGQTEVRAQGRVDIEGDTEILARFDIFYSRVDTVSDRYGMFPGQNAMRPTLAQIREARDLMAETLDAGRYLSEPQYYALLEKAENLRPLVRNFALAATHSSIEDQERVRVDVYSSLRNAFITLSALAFLLLVLAASLIHVSRRLAAKNISELNIIRYLTQLIEVSTDGIVILDRDLKVINVNRAAEWIFGCDRSVLMGRDAMQTLCPQRRTGGMEKRLRALFDDEFDSKNNLYQVPIFARRKDGALFPAELSVVCVRDQSCQKVLVGFVRDLSSQRKARKVTKSALARARNDAAAKQRFLATMSHEMRTPLHSIILASDMALTPDTPTVPESSISVIRAAAQTALDQVEDVLEIARDSAISPEEKVEDLDAEAVAKSLVMQMHPMARARDSQLVFNWTAPDRLRGAPGPFTKIIQNLVSNAINATQHGTVTITGSPGTLKGRPALQIEVADTGRGISDADKENVFHDFFSGTGLDENTTTGTGLGLGIVKRALDTMGGQITFESALGEGTRFQVLIPLSHPPARPFESKTHPVSRDQNAGPDGASDPHLAPPRNPTGEKVLVIEDHATNRQLLEAMLIKLGYEVTTAADGVEGVRCAIETDFDLVLTDINMPRLSGDKVARCLRHSSVSGNACIIAVTAKSGVSDAQGAAIVSGNIDAFLFKPFDSVRLATVISEAREERSFAAEDMEKEVSDRGDLSAPAQKRLVENSPYPDLMAQAKTDMRALLARMADVTGADIMQTGFDDLARFAHYVAGSLLVLGLLDLGHAVADVERMCHDRDRQSLVAFTIILAAETDRLFGDAPAEVTPA